MSDLHTGSYEQFSLPQGYGAYEVSVFAHQPSPNSQRVSGCGQQALNFSSLAQMPSAAPLTFTGASLAQTTSQLQTQAARVSDYGAGRQEVLHYLSSTGSMTPAPMPTGAGRQEAQRYVQPSFVRTGSFAQSTTSITQALTSSPEAPRLRRGAFQHIITQMSREATPQGALKVLHAWLSDPQASSFRLDHQTQQDLTPQLWSLYNQLCGKVQAPTTQAQAPARASSAPLWQRVQPNQTPTPSALIPQLTAHGLSSLARLDQRDGGDAGAWPRFFANSRLPTFKVIGQQSYDTSVANRADTRLDGGGSILMFYRDHETPHSSVFGNFEFCPQGVTVDFGYGPMRFHNAECAFQAAKVDLLFRSGSIDLQQAQGLMSALQGAHTGDDAWSTIRDEINKKAYAQAKSEVKQLWDNSKEQIMLAVVTAKFSQNPTFAAALLSQEGKTLIENSGDAPGDWSVNVQQGQLTGRNFLGCALMQAMSSPLVRAAAAQSPIPPGQFNPHYRGPSTPSPTSNATLATPQPPAFTSAPAQAAPAATGFVAYDGKAIQPPAATGAGALLGLSSTKVQAPHVAPGQGHYTGPPVGLTGSRLSATTVGVALQHGVQLTLNSDIMGIFQQPVDVIVNPAQQALGLPPHIDGLNLAMYQQCGATYQRAYQGLRQQCDCDRAGGGFPSGAAALLPGQRQDGSSQGVMIVAGPDMRGKSTYSAQDQNDLYRCYYNSLALAASQGARTIAFAPVSTNIYAFDRNLAADISARAAQDFARDYGATTSLKQIVFLQAGPTPSIGVK